MIDTIEQHFETSLTDLDLDSKSQECEKENDVTIIQSIWMEYGILLRLVGVMNLKLSLSHPLNIQGREPYLCDFVKKTTTAKNKQKRQQQQKQKNKNKNKKTPHPLTFACIRTFTDQFLSNLDDVRDY